MRLYRFSIILGILALIVFNVGLHTWDHPQILIYWSAPTNTGVIGFNVYRSLDQQQQYVRINSEMILASSEVFQSSQYRFRDTEISSGKLVDYVIEEVGQFGTKERSSPIRIIAGERALLIMTFSGIGIITSLCLLFFDRIINQIRSQKDKIFV